MFYPWYALRADRIFIQQKLFIRRPHGGPRASGGSSLRTAFLLLTERSETLKMNDMKQENIRDEVGQGKREKGSGTNMKLLKQLCESNIRMRAGLPEDKRPDELHRDILN